MRLSEISRVGPFNNSLCGVCYLGEDREDPWHCPWQGSTPEHSFTELSSWGASPMYYQHPLWEPFQRPYGTHVRSCDSLPSCSSGKLISSYSSKIEFLKILFSLLSSSIIGMMRFIIMYTNH